MFAFACLHKDGSCRRLPLAPNGRPRVFMQNEVLRLCGTVYLLTVVLAATTANK